MVGKFWDELKIFEIISWIGIGIIKGNSVHKPIGHSSPVDNSNNKRPNE
jgi:hypothetical protein